MQCIRNLSAVLEEAGSSLQNVVRVGVFLTDMGNFAAMNKVYETMFKGVKPVSGFILYLCVYPCIIHYSSAQLSSELVRPKQAGSSIYLWQGK